MKYVKGSLSFILSLSMVCSMFSPIHAQETEEIVEQDEIVEQEIYTEEETIVEEAIETEDNLEDTIKEEEKSEFVEEYVEESVSNIDDLEDSDALFEGYVNQEMYKSFGMSLYSSNDFGLDTLDSNELSIYNALDTFFTNIANGTSNLAQFQLSNSFVFSTTATTTTELQNDLRDRIVKIVTYLRVNSPYEFYWFDKTNGFNYGYSYSGFTAGSSYTIRNLTMYFTVADAYADTAGTTHTISGNTSYIATLTSKTSATTTAIANAQTIVNNASSYDEYSKMKYFKEQICSLTSYNHAAVNNDEEYGDPWQLIYVFDNDSTTNVVCEGYSKAFQYLCDLSGLECYTVEGAMGGGTGSGGHMWNIVTLEGYNYMVDVTNCDSGTIGSPDLLFLKGMSGNASSGYKKTINGTTIQYVYDSDQMDYYGDILTLSSTDYVYDPTISLNKETTNILAGSSQTLVATVDPENTKVTWSSDNEAIAKVSSKGVVTAVAAGTVTITATTPRGKTATCTINVWNKTSNVSSVKNGETGIDITWKEVPGALRYSLYRKVDGGSWKALKTGITTTSYTDTTAESGTKYYYSMLATDGNVKTTYSTTGKHVTYLSKPVISSVVNTQNELKITWKAVTGAASYIIYDEAGNKVGTSTTTSFTDTNATVSGTTYNYQVKAKVGNATYSVLSDTKSCMKLAQPTLSSAKNGDTGVVFTWKAVNGATAYNVYRKVSGGSWALKAKDVEGTSWTDTSATSGKKYYYTVKAKNGTAISTYNTTGKYVTYLSKPEITKCTRYSSYNSVKFNAVTGAEKYILYKVNKDGTKSSLTTITATDATTYTYKDTSAKTSGTYRYVVRAKVGSATYSVYSDVFTYIRS